MQILWHIIGERGPFFFFLQGKSNFGVLWLMRLYGFMFPVQPRYGDMEVMCPPHYSLLNKAFMFPLMLFKIQ